MFLSWEGIRLEVPEEKPVRYPLSRKRDLRKANCRINICSTSLIGADSIVVDNSKCSPKRFDSTTDQAASLGVGRMEKAANVLFESRIYRSGRVDRAESAKAIRGKLARRPAVGHQVSQTPFAEVAFREIMRKTVPFISFCSFCCGPRYRFVHRRDVGRGPSRRSVGGGLCSRSLRAR